MTNEEFFNILGKKYRKNPVLFTEHALGIYTWSKMREIMNSVRDNKYTAVRACHGSSKTFTAAIVAIWFFNMFLNAKVITTAPTGDQVELLLWTEINKIYRTSRVDLIGECLIRAIKDREAAEHFAVGFSTDKQTRAEGWHAPRILFIIDEAKGVPQWFWDAMKGALGSGYCRVLAISTTDGVSAGEHYHSIFTTKRVGKKWNKIAIDVFELPEFTGEKLRIRDYETANKEEKAIGDLNIQLSGKGWEQECKEEWGKDSVLYLTKCRGQISDDTPDSIIKLSQVMKMIDNHEKKVVSDIGGVEVGVDVARKGDDATVFYMRKGMKVLKKHKHHKRNLEVLCDDLERFVDHKKLKSEVLIKMDATGMGWGPFDIMERRGYKNIIPVHNNQVARDENKYPNAASEMWYETSEIIQDISWEEEESLKAQLVNRKGIDLDKKGRRQVESKKDYKKRHGKSPDEADAFLLCFYRASSGAVAGTVDYDVY